MWSRLKHSIERCSNIWTVIPDGTLSQGSQTEAIAGRHFDTRRNA